MPKLYEYQTTYHRTTDTLRVNECGQGVHIGVNSIVQMPPSEDDHEQTTSIVLPLNEVPLLIEALSNSIDNEEGRAVLKLNGTQLKALIYSLELALDVHDGEIDLAAKPYDLLEVLNTELNCLIERDKANTTDNKRGG